MPADLHVGFLFRLWLLNRDLRRKLVRHVRGVKETSDDDRDVVRTAARIRHLHKFSTHMFGTGVTLHDLRERILCNVLGQAVRTQKQRVTDGQLSVVDLGLQFCRGTANYVWS